jgi:hypothetical protein
MPLPNGSSRIGRSRFCSTTRLRGHGVSYDGERVETDLIVRDQIIRIVEVPDVDLGERHELFDLDCVRALDLDRVDLVVLDLEVLAFRDLVAAALVVSFDDLARYLVHELLAQPVASLLVNLAERDALAGRRPYANSNATEQKPPGFWGIWAPATRTCNSKLEIHE